MDTATFLRRERAVIVREAQDALARLRERHYEAAGVAASEQRLEILFDHLVGAISTRDLSPVVNYAGDVARERFEANYDLSEVQAAFNTLESATWRRILADLPADDLAEALGLVSTVFGAAKDALGRQYVSLATHAHAPSLDLSALFAGTDGVQGGVGLPAG
jgi:hypothetical protein